MSTLLANFVEHVTIKRLLFLSCGLAIVKFRKLIYKPIRHLYSPLRHLPGPPSNNWFLGHFFMLLEAQNTTIWETWIEKYGSIMQIRGFCGEYHLCIWDMRAVNHVLTHNTTFIKSEIQRRSLGIVLGEGILSADEETHKRQRRIMNPAFGALHIRNLLPTFATKANQLRDIWVEMLRDNPEGETIDILPWLTRATLDIIGLAGFGYDFRSLEDEDKDELSEAYTELFNSNQDLSVLQVLKGLICLALGIHTEDSRRFDANQATINRVGMGLIRDKKAVLQGDAQNEESRGRDLLTLLIKSNLAETDSRQAMSDAEVLGQISTFLAAGHETTSSTTAWALYALTKHPEVQSKLRDELERAKLGEEPSMDEIDNLGYLNNFIREVLRVYAVISLSGREVAHDTIIPVEGYYRDSHGKIQTGIRVQKGDSVAIPILSINRAKYIWGEDAMEFNPERWNNLPDAVKEMPGVWGNVLTFLHGPHACIGYRFAVEEMKILLYALVRSFEFEIDPNIEIEGKLGMATPKALVDNKYGPELAEYLSKGGYGHPYELAGSLTRQHIIDAVHSLAQPERVTYQTFETLMALEWSPLCDHLDLLLDNSGVFPLCIKLLRELDSKRISVFDRAYGFMCLQLLALAVDIGKMAQVDRLDKFLEEVSQLSEGRSISPYLNNYTRELEGEWLFGHPEGPDGLADLLGWEKDQAGHRFCLPRIGGCRFEDAMFLLEQIWDDRKTFLLAAQLASRVFPGWGGLLLVIWNSAVQTHGYAHDLKSETSRFKQQAHWTWMFEIALRYGLYSEDREDPIMGHMINSYSLQARLVSPDTYLSVDSDDGNQVVNACVRKLTTGSTFNDMNPLSATILGYSCRMVQPASVEMQLPQLYSAALGRVWNEVSAVNQMDAQRYSNFTMHIIGLNVRPQPEPARMDENDIRNRTK
ncbi:Bifunctional P-450/NADPH-P450 reductase [Rhizoctonia solani]|uniref:Bifunctional P-450/NADPH-P450 reductase n=1 Tax=Rhizoctonia solani TaxID=456999 RepID=A0A0K6G2Q3_9AGAM|nr:Bifunctional P-450/NADPH-P450 reductase [Rhizoctonia solani]